MPRWIEDPSIDAPDGHTWQRPAPHDCPTCTCCTARLCAQAAQDIDPISGEQGVPCVWLAPSDADTVRGCPCSTT